MLVPDEIRKCVGFVGYKSTSGEHRLAGTVFFVSVETPDKSLAVGYAVTAKHVIDGISERGGKVHLRLNLVGTDATWFEMEFTDWRYHPEDPSVDVAVAEVHLDQRFDHLHYPADGFATDEIISTKQIGIGEDVFLTGLFHSHAGIRKNIPIVRVGNIAAMPEERVATKVFGDIEA